MKLLIKNDMTYEINDICVIEVKSQGENICLTQITL
jgi:hypothetical protein